VSVLGYFEGDFEGFMKGCLQSRVPCLSPSRGTDIVFVRVEMWWITNLMSLRV